MKDDMISRQAAIEAMRKAKDKSEAHRMLVQLPSAQPDVPDTNVGDMISRQAAISEIMEDIKDRSLHDDPATPEDYAEGYDEGIRNAAAIVLQMPSAQPDHIGEVTEMVGDVISRQAAVDVLHGYFDGMLETDTVCPKDLYNEIEALPSVTPKQPGWIPCSRELPKPNEEDGNGFHKAYLVQDGRWMDVARWNGKYWVAWGYSTVLLNVVAWMPLPAPYIPEGDDKYEG